MCLCLPTVTAAEMLGRCVICYVSGKSENNGAHPCFSVFIIHGVFRFKNKHRPNPLSSPLEPSANYKNSVWGFQCDSEGEIATNKHLHRSVVSGR